MQQGLVQLETDCVVIQHTEGQVFLAGRHTLVKIFNKGWIIS
jgi:hypothetical protein